MANSIYLIASFMLMCKHVTPEEAMAPFAGLSITPYRDATCGMCSYTLPIIECLRGLEFAAGLGWFSLQSFDIDAYEKYEKFEGGDINWIIPNKFVAFSGPCVPNAVPPLERHLIFIRPEFYVPIFKKIGVKTVVRLNRKQYNSKSFTDKGINHVDLYFVDGSCPPLNIVTKFLEIAEADPSALAVHCKAGLGRTGTLIGCYAMKNYQFPPAAWIGWNRICRPGSVLGPQQHFLHQVQRELQTMGSCFAPPLSPRQIKNENKLSIPITPPTAGSSETVSTPMTNDDLQKAKKGDIGQGERLVKSKAGRTSPSPMASSPTSKKQLTLSADSQNAILNDFPLISMPQIANMNSSSNTVVSSRINSPMTLKNTALSTKPPKVTDRPFCL